MITSSTQRSQAGGFKVFIDGNLLDPGPSQKVYNHSPDGFAWGYHGSGPAQLALAILLHFAGEKFARENYQQFKFDVIANLNPGAFELSEDVVKEWIGRKSK